MDNLHSPPSMPKYDQAAMNVARVDEQILRYKHGLYDLYSQRNSLSPIFRLPTETVQAIFIQLARDSCDQSNTPCFCWPRWVNVSYVCRHWRAVALMCSTFWSYLLILSPRWTEELLARSKRASLKLKVEISVEKRSQASRFMKQVADHAERIQELCIDLPAYGRVDLSILSSPAPRLTSLRISGMDIYPESYWPSTLFDGDTPMLRRLDLTRCPIPWYSLKLTGLTSLSLCRVHEQFRQNMVDFLDTLRCMADLTHLSLDNALSSASNFFSSAACKTFQKIDLPHLSRLQISAPISTVIALMHCLRIPLKTVVRLECTFEPDLSLHDYALLSSLLAQRFDTSNARALSNPLIRSLGIAFAGELATLAFSVSEHGCSITPSPTCKIWDHDVPLEIAFCSNESTGTDHDWSGRDIDIFISDICCSLPLTYVRNLWVSEPPLSSAFWKRTLGFLQGIRELVLNQGPMPDLTPLLSAGNGENQARDCVPALETLQLSSISFGPRKPAHRNAPRLTDVQSLYDALSRREESGLLVMSRCVVSKEGIAVDLDMFGMWDHGHFHVLEERAEIRRYAQSDSEAEDDQEESDESDDPESVAEE